MFRFVNNFAFLARYAVSVLLYLSKFVLFHHVLKFHFFFITLAYIIGINY